MKGIILAGGSGTRLSPLTKVISKQLLPIGDKPMIYYPLSVLMLANIKEILIISTPKDLPLYKELLGSGSQIGISISYKEQPKPEGLAQAFIIGEEFIGDDDVCLILGDNIFYGEGFTDLLSKSVEYVKKKKEAVVYGYTVKNPREFGIIEFDSSNKVICIEEKPKEPKSSYAVIGIYFYPNDVIQISKNVKPSNRGEYEITSINNQYLSEKRLNAKLLGRGFAWLDTGTAEAMLSASNFISNVENLQGLKIGCLEEIALRKKFISLQQFQKTINSQINSSYNGYLKSVLKKSKS